MRDEVCHNLVNLLELRGNLQSDRIGYTFVDGDKHASYSYGLLRSRARAIGATLQALGAQGERVMIFYQPGLDYIEAFFGCLYAGAIAIPATLPKRNRPSPRLQAMIGDANARFALTTTDIYASYAQQIETHPALNSLRWVHTDAIASETECNWVEYEPDRNALAFLQYTSGSTSAPKGVMITHANLLHNLDLIGQRFEHTSESQGVIWLPPYHDMGLIGGILHPLYANFPVKLMPPTSFLQSPFLWLQAITEARATTSGGPNFAYDLCVQAVTEEQRAQLDLSSWRVAFVGAEPVRHATLERFAERFASCGFQKAAFYPTYGLAEATLFVAGGAVADAPPARAFDLDSLQNHRACPAMPEKPSITLVGCGWPAKDQRICIVDPQELRACVPGQIGEIWVAGPSVAVGYWDRIEATNATFGAQIAGDGPFLRTGDLGFIQDGELFITGRIKELIIIRGRNHYPQDLEQTSENSWDGFRRGSAAAFTVEVAGEEQLVLVHELERQHRQADVDAIAGRVRRAIADEHDLHVYAVVLVRPGGVSKTTSGKIQRLTCRELFLAGSLNPIGVSMMDGSMPAELQQPRVLLERTELLQLAPEAQLASLSDYLRDLLARVLNSNPARLPTDLPLGFLGLDSIQAIGLQHQLETDWGFVLQASDFLQDNTLQTLAMHLSEHLHHVETIPMQANLDVGQVNLAPASLGQQALWFIQQLNSISGAYNITFALRITGELDIQAFEKSWQIIAERHQALRTTFSEQTNQLMQSIQLTSPVRIERQDMIGQSQATVRDALTKFGLLPFDLERGPLLRLLLCATGPYENIFVFSAHHCVFDFWSLTVVLDECFKLYPTLRHGTALTLPTPSAQMGDYVRWQNTLLEGQVGAALAHYWQQQLAASPLRLALPLDHPRPAAPSFHGRQLPFELDERQLQQLKLLAQSEATTLYVTLLSIFYLMLFIHTRQQDILVGSPMAGRSMAQFKDTVGYLANPVALRGQLFDNPTFKDFVRRIRKTVLDALNHQDYPFPLLVQKLEAEREPGLLPVFQVWFVLHKPHLLKASQIAPFITGAESAGLPLDNLTLQPYALEQRVCRYDLMLMLVETDTSVLAQLHYNVDLFEEETIQAMALTFRSIVDCILHDPNTQLMDIDTQLNKQRHDAHQAHDLLIREQNQQNIRVIKRKAIKSAE